MSVQVSEVSSRSDLEDFLDFPHTIYANDPAWVAPLRPWVRRRLSARNPFFTEAGLKLFIARRGTEVVGTISALRDRQHEKHRGEKVCFFGFFETVQDQAVATALLDRAAEQAKEWGSEILRGPRNLTRIEETGLLVEGFDKTPPFFAGHHPDWYRGLIESQGFSEHHDVYAFDIPAYDALGNNTELPEDLTQKARAVDIDGLEVRSVDWFRTNRDLRLAHQVFVEGFRDVPENTPMPRTQFIGLGRAFLFLSNRHMLQLATVHGKPAGFALCFPEINEAVRRARGRLHPQGIARFLHGLRKIRTASFKLLSVLPEYRGTGLHALLIERAIEGVRDAGYDRLEASLIDARNGPMRRIVEGAGMKPYKRYRVYERPVA